MAGYYDKVMNAGYSQTYIKHRFGKVKTILNHAAKRGVAPDEVASALAYCRILVPPRANGTDPHPISKQDFQRLLKSADRQWKAMLLLCLNACMYGSEVAVAEREEVDLTAGTLIADRPKTGVTRVAVLWDRTVQALRQLRSVKTNHQPYLFVSQAGGPYAPETMRGRFDRLRKKAGVDKDVKISDIRDGAYTAAVQGEGVEFEMARILAGHRTGVSDHYIKRNPKMVAAACRAIEEHYF